MEAKKLKKFLKEDNYVHCSICGNFRNINAFSHRKSKEHQKKLSFKLRKIAFHLSKKKKVEVVIHDEQWPEKETESFCHFCGKTYKEHCVDGEFVVEHLGSLYHHADFQHVASVKEFLDRNFCKEKSEKYYIQKSDLDSFFRKLPEVKEKYLKKMDILNALTVQKIKSVEAARKNVVADALLAQASVNPQEQVFYATNRNENLTASCSQASNLVKGSSISTNLGQPSPVINSKNESDVVPPWLEDVVNKPSTSVIGPTMETLVKHVTKLKEKKNLPKNRVGAFYKHVLRSNPSAKWLPSFQGPWKKGHRKHSKSTRGIKKGSV